MPLRKALYLLSSGYIVQRYDKCKERDLCPRYACMKNSGGINHCRRGRR